MQGREVQEKEANVYEQVINGPLLLINGMQSWELAKPV